MSVDLYCSILASAQRRVEIRDIEIAQLRAELATTKRELERWRTGTQIEGDYVGERDYQVAPSVLGTCRSDNLPIGVEPALQRAYERGPGEP